MKASIFQSTKHFDEKIRDDIYSLLSKSGIEKDEDNPDLVFYVGGDGTFLRAIQKYINILDQVTFIGIKNGTLGFFYGFGLEDIPHVISSLKENKLSIHTFNLLEGNIYHDDKIINTIYALNEIRLENPFHTLISEVHIDSDLLETFRGNGLSVCSSLGSTGYNKSLGGAILDPSNPLMELTEIAPLSNNIYRSLGSSIVMGKNHTITLSGDFPNIIIGYDCNSIEEDKATSINISISKKSINVAYDHDFSFISSIRKSFIK